MVVGQKYDWLSHSGHGSSRVLPGHKFAYGVRRRPQEHEPESVSLCHHFYYVTTFRLAYRPIHSVYGWMGGLNIF